MSKLSEFRVNNNGFMDMVDSVVYASRNAVDTIKDNSRVALMGTVVGGSVALGAFLTPIINDGDMSAYASSFGVQEQSDSLAMGLKSHFEGIRSFVQQGNLTEEDWQVVVEYLEHAYMDYDAATNNLKADIPDFQVVAAMVEDGIVNENAEQVMEALAVMDPTLDGEPILGNHRKM